MNRNLVPLFILSLIFLHACGGGGSSTGSGGGGGAQAIIVTFLSLPPSSLMTGTNYGVSATVTNDSKNAGGCVWVLPPRVDSERRDHDVYRAELGPTRWPSNPDCDFRNGHDQERSSSGHHHSSRAAAHRCFHFHASASHDGGFHHRAA
jgi:hypothetical protein